ncbi:MAG: AraC family transcriptional regulator [Clostridiales bacterium]|nr:AraC family transcriptional regulator [Clostridiales bacterium]
MYNALIVDDEIRMIEALEDEVDWKRCGIRNLFKAIQINEAIAVIQNNKIDILICDIEMPEGSGLKLVEWLQEHGYKLSCIFVTCHPEFGYMRRAIQLKCYDYILKPVDYEEFSRVLAELVSNMEEKLSDTLSDGLCNPSGMTNLHLKTLEQEKNDRNIELEVKKYIRDHMLDDISVGMIAEELHFNPQHLTRMFKNKTGYGITEYVTVVRMEMAKKILKDTSIPIKEVAGMVGYKDYAYFTRVFKKEFSIAPKEYREKQRKD